MIKESKIHLDINIPLIKPFWLCKTDEQFNECYLNLYKNKISKEEILSHIIIYEYHLNFMNINDKFLILKEYNKKGNNRITLFK